MALHLHDVTGCLSGGYRVGAAGRDGDEVSFEGEDGIVCLLVCA